MAPRDSRSKMLKGALGAVLAAVALALALADGAGAGSFLDGVPGEFAQGSGLPSTQLSSGGSSFDLADVPAYSGKASVVLGDNVPDFSPEDMTEKSFESYSELDDLGRCGPAFANLGRDLMPTSKRGDISEVKPTGWKQNFYDFVEKEALYNRSHLIAHSLAGEDANRENLITGTRYMNADGMLPYEEEVADYIRDTGNHVLYRVTPVFDGDDLLASGVRMEAYSVEDEGRGVCFDVYCYNVQPGVDIDYATGANRAA